MKTMPTIARLKEALLSILLLLFAGNANAGVPVTGLLICCRGSDMGPFLINGKWNPSHDYNDIEQVRGILSHIQNAGINVVCIDMTNPSQWDRMWNQFRPMIENIRTVCAEKKMEYCIMIGGILGPGIREEVKVPASVSDLAYWNGKAKIIWDNWAQDSHYRAYGFGDNRKILNIFYPHELYNPIWEAGADTNKNYLSKFYLGTHQYNQRFVDGPIDGWGYRDKQQNASGTIRFVCPSEGLHPSTSKRISAQQWKDRVDWASQAEHYSIYGSYDDTCDSIQWGIQDTKNTRPGSKKNPTDDPYMYYNVVKNKLTSNNTLPKTGDLLDSGLSRWEVFMGVPHKSVEGLPEGTPVFDSATVGIPLGLNKDPKKVFTTKTENGETVLHITGEIYGALSTKESFSNYHLKADFKWGERKWIPRLNAKRNNGIFYHCYGEHGTFWNVWKSCIEYQVQETDLGDLYLLAGPKCKSRFRSLDGKTRVFDPQSTSPWSDSGGHVSASHEPDRPHGEWNHLEVYVLGNTAIHVANGIVVLAIIDAVDGKGNPLKSGQIQLQSEAAECFYKNIQISPITAYPVDIAAKAGLSVDGKPLP